MIAVFRLSARSKTQLPLQLTSHGQPTATCPRGASPSSANVVAELPG